MPLPTVVRLISVYLLSIAFRSVAQNAEDECDGSCADTVSLLQQDFDLMQSRHKKQSLAWVEDRVAPTTLSASSNDSNVMVVSSQRLKTRSRLMAESSDDDIMRFGKVEIENVSGLPERWVFIHIPKNAGDSFMNVAPEILPVGATLWGNAEVTLAGTKNPHGASTAAFLRNPEESVLSQFLECKYDRWGKLVTRGTKFPDADQDDVYDGFDEWVQHFAAMKPDHNESNAVGRTVKVRNMWPFSSWVDGKPCGKPNSLWTGYTPWGVCAHPDWVDMFHCYNPWNLQARYLGTEDTAGHGATLAGLVPNLEKAKSGLRSLGFLGIQEMYDESVCLFRYAATGSIPESCACGGPGAVLGEQVVRAHASPEHDIEEVNSALREKIRGMIKVDADFYVYALSVFEERLHEAEKRFNMIIACPGKLEAVKSSALDLQMKIRLHGTRLDSAEAALTTRAAQTTVADLATTVGTKAAQSSLDTLTTAVGAKAA